MAAVRVEIYPKLKGAKEGLGTAALSAYHAPAKFESVISFEQCRAGSPWESPYGTSNRRNRFVNDGPERRP
jgi:hypothetical protein